MCSFDQEVLLEELLRCCSEPESRCWEQAWREFLSRYKHFMFFVISSYCARFNHPRIQKQRTELINDIFSDALGNLYKNDCRALKDFQERQSEVAFRAYLRIICLRVAYIHVQRIMRELLDENLELAQRFLKSVSGGYTLMQIYEDLISTLRDCKKNERDISIFMLFVWADFSEKMIRTIPIYTEIGDRVVNLAVSRCRSCLKEKLSSPNFF